MPAKSLHMKQVKARWYHSAFNVCAATALSDQLGSVRQDTR